MIDLFLFKPFRQNDYRLFELLSDCYVGLGLTEHAIIEINLAINCKIRPVSILKKAAQLYESVGETYHYLRLFSQYFETSLSNQNDVSKFEVLLLLY